MSCDAVVNKLIDLVTTNLVIQGIVGICLYSTSLQWKYISLHLQPLKQRLHVDLFVNYTLQFPVMVIGTV